MERILVIFFSFFILFVFWLIFSLSPVARGPAHASLEISNGFGFSDVADILDKRNIIRSRNAFLIYGVLSGSAHRLKPGNYFLSLASSTSAIMRLLTQGSTTDVKITIPEGVTLKDIDVMLSNAGILTSGALLNFPIAKVAPRYGFLANVRDLEGFLFPDTYKFFQKSETSEVVKKFLDNFEKKAWFLLEGCQMPSLNKCSGLDARRLLTLASILEKEVSFFRDRQIIAGILNKRLILDMPLQVDASVVYTKCSRAFVTCENPKVFRSDTKWISSYNTYLYKGLPPGPIGNPGLEAIKAALSPIFSDYLYYLSDSRTKRTIFSKTLDEHNENRAKYLGV